MTRSERLENIYNKFDQAAKAYCQAAGGISCEISCEYGGENTPDNLKFRFAKIFFNAFAVEFRYTAHGVFSTVNSILDCLVFLSKKEDELAIPLPFFADFCDKNAFPLVIPFITDEAGMQQAFDCITGALDDMTEQFLQIVYDDNRKSDFLSYYYKELEYVFDTEIDESSDSENSFYKSASFYSFFTSRFTSNAFIQFIKGNRPRAVKELSKCKRLFGYEKRMLDVLQSEQEIAMPDISEVSKNLELYNDMGVPKANFKEFLALFVSWFVIGAGVALIYAGVFMLFYLIAKHNAVYLMGSLYNLPYCFLGAFITGIAGSYFTRFWFYKLLFKKDHERYAEIDHITNGGKSDKIMKYFAGIIVTCCVVLCILLPNCNIKFKNDRFTDNTKLFSLAGKNYGYDEIDYIYYRPDRVDGFGDRLDFPSYVMVLKNGQEIDFYDYDEIENYETTLLDFLQTRGVKIIKKEQV
ncbi:MAG: hypothetical protein IJL87_02050 [Clostridia bacterium]|nr:hypothetical protein [Clostridia bacterium]